MHISVMFCAEILWPGMRYKAGANMRPTKRSTKHFKAAEDWQIQQDGWGDRERLHVEKMEKRKHARGRKRKRSKSKLLWLYFKVFYSIHITLRFRITGLTLPDNIQSKQLNVFDCISLSWSFDRSYSVVPCAHLDVFQCIPFFHWASGCVLQSVANIWWVSVEFHNKCT